MHSIISMLVKPVRNFLGAVYRLQHSGTLGCFRKQWRKVPKAKRKFLFMSSEVVMAACSVPKFRTEGLTFGNVLASLE